MSLFSYHTKHVIYTTFLMSLLINFEMQRVCNLFLFAFYFYSFIYFFFFLKLKEAFEAGFFFPQYENDVPDAVAIKAFCLNFETEYPKDFSLLTNNYPNHFYEASPKLNSLMVKKSSNVDSGEGDSIKFSGMLIMQLYCYIIVCF